MKNTTNLSRSTAKQHCRTCLIKINFEEGDIMDILKNDGVQSLLIELIGSLWPEDYKNDYPQHICLNCFNKVQQIESFVQQARSSSEKLLSVFNGTNSDVWNNEESSRDEYKLLLKDTLMETESIMLENATTLILVDTEINNPDPFSNSLEPLTRISSLQSNLNSLEESDNEPERINDYSNNESNNYLKNSNTHIKIKSDESSKNDVEENLEFSSSQSYKKPNKPNTRLRIKLGEMLRKKKKRRTKKEMEQIRVKQLEHDAQTSKKRRQKGTKNSFKCSQCNHGFAHKITLDAHVRKVHEGDKRPFRCDRCEKIGIDKSYSFIGGLYTHIKEIHEAQVRSYACNFPTCERIYTSYIAMQKHKRLKHMDSGEQKKYVCEHCGATFNQTGNLKHHRRTKHPTEDEKAEKEREKERFECDICKKLFHSRYTLKYHTLQLHTNETKYECNVCGRKMAKKFMLVQHMLVHSTEKIPCEHCGKQFIRKFELEAHIKAVHMKLKPFECQYCSECFASRKTLRHHEYIHTGEKPYVCDTCGQAFRQQTCLKNHRKSHEKVGCIKSPSKQNLNQSIINSTTGNGSQQNIESTTAIS